MLIKKISFKYLFVYKGIKDFDQDWLYYSMVLKFPFQLRRILYKYYYIYNTIYVNKENKKKNESKM